MIVVEPTIISIVVPFVGVLRIDDGEVMSTVIVGPSERKVCCFMVSSWRFGVFGSPVFRELHTDITWVIIFVLGSGYFVYGSTWHPFVFWNEDFFIDIFPAIF